MTASVRIICYFVTEDDDGMTSNRLSDDSGVELREAEWLLAQ